MDEERNPYFETAFFHQNGGDNACQIYYTVENKPTEGSARLRDLASGFVLWQLQRIADGVNVGHPVYREFDVFGVPYNTPYPDEGVSVSIQCKRPSPPAAPAGYRYLPVRMPDGRLALRYESAVVWDRNTHAAAEAVPDPDWNYVQPTLAELRALAGLS